MKIYIELSESKKGERGAKAKNRKLWLAEITKILTEGSLNGYTKIVRFQDGDTLDELGERLPL